MKKTPKKRQRLGKTSYKKRIGLLKSGLGRVVVRKTNKYLIVQYVESDEAKDKVIEAYSSKDLLKHGWKKEKTGSLKSIPAAYLTGKLLGKKISGKKVILDIGLQRSISGSRLFAVLKGLVDSGVDIAYDKKAFPSEDRIHGKHLKEDIQKMIKEVEGKL